MPFECFVCHSHVAEVYEVRLPIKTEYAYQRKRQLCWSCYRANAWYNKPEPPAIQAICKHSHILADIPLSEYLILFPGYNASMFQKQAGKISTKQCIYCRRVQEIPEKVQQDRRRSGGRHARNQRIRRYGR
jgi:hypothetical protein